MLFLFYKFRQFDRFYIEFAWCGWLKKTGRCVANFTETTFSLFVFLRVTEFVGWSEEVSDFIFKAIKVINRQCCSSLNGNVAK